MAQSTLKRTGWILLVIVWIAGLLLVWIGRGMIAGAGKRVADADARSLQATALAAGLAWDKVQEARGLVDVKDLRRAGVQLQEASGIVDVMRVVAPPERQRDISKVRDDLEKAQEKLTSDTEGVAENLREAGQGLYDLSGRPAGRE